ncbi:hypothetical protein OOK36_41165 [Streptomyces sp. NBC_00365]|uniref:hypothetical protein n=1 Tax=Streptomyces sp. NBC_00365 TaxID=2975726 RepID=UPI00225B4FC2|nr:hypothetical protein [Streptomyces sp. NBC_00365]MCX5095149.1 hypothetical protein [Streptomyces sp. NBC_00365]
MTFTEASEHPELTFRKALPAYAVIHQVAPVHASPARHRAPPGTDLNSGPVVVRRP